MSKKRMLKNDLLSNNKSFLGFIIQFRFGTYKTDGDEVL